MGDGFASPIANAIGQLIRKALQSVNFIAGVSGWQITRDGDAEFNNVTMRGELDLGVTPNPRIVFGPAIPASLNFSADFDWDQAVLWYWNADSYYFEVIGTYLPGPFPTRARGTYDNSTGFTVIHEFLQGPGAGNLNFVLYGSATYSDQPTNFLWRNGGWGWENGTATFAADTDLTISGSARAFALYGAVGFNNEIWTNVTLLNSWTGTFSYRRVASPANSIQVAGNITPGTKTDGTQIGVIPVGYRPNTSQDITINAFGGVISTAQPPHINVAPGGSVTIWGLGTSTGVGFSGMYAMDW